MNAATAVQNGDSGGAVRAHYDDRTGDALVSEYYQGSGFLNFGYWEAHTESPAAASAALVDQLLSLLPSKGGDVLDVACGTGASSAHVSTRWPDARVTALNLSLQQLEAARLRAPAARLVQMDAAHLAFADQSFDQLLCVEAAFHFRTRERFLREAARVLRPGGGLALSDVLICPEKGRARAHWDPLNLVEGVEDYRTLLEDAGFGDVRVIDATRECWVAGFWSVVRFAHEKLWAGALDVEGVDRFLDRVYRLTEDLDAYLLIAAIRGAPKTLRRISGPSAPERALSAVFDIAEADRSADSGYDTLMYWPALEEYYENSDFVNYGLWDGSPRTAREACERLVDRLVEFLPERSGPVLDVGCGKGATARYLSRYWAAGEIFGINISPKQLRRCVENAPDSLFSAADAVALPFADACFRVVLCVEAAFHFVTRERFLREARRVLAPGGYLLLADLLLSRGGEAGRRVGTPENFVPGLDRYRELLRRAGFREPQVIDTTRETLGGSYWNLVQFSHERLLDGRMTPAQLRAFTRRFYRGLPELRFYLVASAHV